MSVTFIIGPSGSGKSQFVYDSACKKAVNRSDSIKIMVPEQYTLETEKQIISKSRTGGLININVVSFNRLAYKGLNKIGGGNIPVIDEEVKNIFIRKIINEGKCALKIYNNSALKRGVTDELKSVISELLQYGIDSEKLKEASVKISDKKLSDKLSDISYIYDKFKESVTDNKSMTLEELIPGFTKRLSESDYMDDSIVYLDGYTGFTPAQYDLLRVIIKKAREVYITVTANEFESLRNAMSADSGNMSHNNIGDLFFMSNDIICYVTDIAKENEVEINEPVFLENPVRYDERKDLVFLEKNILKNNGERFYGKAENIRILETNTVDEELKYVAGEIYDLTRNKGLRYRDIAVVAGDINGIAPSVKKIMRDNNIPIFIDEKSGLDNNKFLQYMRYISELSMGKFNYNNIIGLIKTGIFDISEEDIFKIENYTLALGINTYTKWNSEWERRTKKEKERRDHSALKAESANGYTDAYNIANADTARSESGAGNHGWELYDLDRLNEIRACIMSEINMLKGAMADKAVTLNIDSRDVKFEAAGTVGEKAERFIDFLNKSNVDDKIERYIDSVKELNPSAHSENTQLIEKIFDILNNMKNILGDMEVDKSGFMDMFAAALEGLAIGIIPPTNDQVIIGDMERTRLGNVKAVFIIGANEGSIPKTHSDGGILTDSERSRLEREAGLSLSPSIKERSFIQRFYMYLMLTKASDKLYILYTKKDVGGSSLFPSFLIKEICDMYPTLNPERVSNEVACANIIIPKANSIILPGSSNAKSILDAFNRELIVPDERNILLSDALYNSVVKGSVSRFETFARCPHMHFLNYGMKLKPREVYEFNQMDMGVFAHEIMQISMEKLKDGYIDLANISDAETVKLTSDIVGSVFDKYSYLTETDRGLFLKKSLESRINRSLLANIAQIKGSGFMPDRLEQGYSYNMALENGDRISFSGIIDRIDMCTNEDDKYIRVIDYKTGNRYIDLNDVYDGRQLQMIMYLEGAIQSIYKDETIIPAGVFISHINDPVIEYENVSSDVDTEIQKELSLSGIINSDPDIIELLDRAKTSNLIDKVKFKKDGSMSKSSAIMMSTEQFAAARNFEVLKIKSIGKKILHGDIEPRPYKKQVADVKNPKENTACQYCDYGNICSFSYDNKAFKYNNCSKMKTDEIISLITLKGENNE